MAKAIKAYCWASGLIEFGTGAVPDGAILLCLGARAEVEEAITAMARHSRQTGNLIVPGVPEAMDEDAAVDAVLAFQDRLFDRGLRITEAE